MKPLNRPMFRYGGPIKEGIMTGMKDRAALVGNPVFPKASDGRAKHAYNFLLQGLYAGARAAIPRIASLFRTQVGTKTMQKAGPTLINKGTFVPAKGVRIPSSGTYSGVKFQPGKNIGTGTAEMPVYGPNILGRDPTVRLIGGIYKGVTSPTAKGIGGKAAQLVFSPTGVITGLLYANGKYFNKDTGEEVPPPENADELIIGDRVTGTSGAPGGGDPGMYLEPRTDDPKKTKSEENEALKQKYYKIMGLDKMKKDAVYDSLIDASKIVSEEGADLKGSLKSGTLQNRIIQAISGQLDKSAALKKQIDAAILKGEITKDIKANDPAEKNKAKLVEKQIELADQKLSGGTLIDNISEGIKNSGGANSTSNVYNSILKTYKTEPTVLADTTEAAEFRKSDNYTTDAALVKTIVETQGKGPGIYILDKTAIYIDEQGNASTLYQG